MAETAFKVSLIELLFLLRALGLRFPACCPDSGKWIRPDLISFGSEPQTVAVQLRLLRIAMRYVTTALRVESRMLGGLDVSRLGVLIPLDGWGLFVDGALLEACRADILDLFGARPIRAARDLARPF